jgi:hypothetical protein
MVDNSAPPPSRQVASQEGAQALQAALALPIPKLYANGYIHSIGAGGDVTTLFYYNGAPVAMMSFSLTTMKTLLADLGKAMSQFEEQSNVKIPTIHELTNLITENLAETQR